MASANWMVRGRHTRMRALRYRSDNEEEKIKIDFERDPKLVIHEILSNVCLKHQKQQSEARTLAYLNAFVKFLDKLHQSSTPNDLGFSMEDILLCLRAVLVQESSTVRSAGLRVLRHLLKTKQSFLILNKVQIPILIARSVDLLFQNHNERVQALQLVRHLLNVAPEFFPLQIARAVVAAVFPAAGDNDRLIRSCLAILCELGLSNPDVFIACGGVKALMHNLPLLTSPQMIEAIIGVLVFLMNKPATRSKAKIDLFCLVASFTDLKTDDSQTVIASSCWCLLSLLRSWPGVLHFCNPNYRGLVSYVAALRLKQDNVRRAVLDLTFDLLNLEQPKWTDDVSVALESVNPSCFKDSYKVTEEFVTAEGKSGLPCLTKSRVNLIETHTALLLYCFLKAGLLDALVEVIISPDPFLSIRATILLGEILHLAHFLLPPECCNLSPALPNLVSYAVRGHPVLPVPSHFGIGPTKMPKIPANEDSKSFNYAQFSTAITRNKRSSAVANDPSFPTADIPLTSKPSKSSVDSPPYTLDAEYTSISNVRREAIGVPLGLPGEIERVPFFIDQFCKCYVSGFGSPDDCIDKDNMTSAELSLFTNYFKAESIACIHSQQRAMSAVSTLTNLHYVMQKKPSPTTIYLEHIITNVERKNVLDLASLAKLKCKQSSSKSKIQTALLKECDEQIRESEVLNQKNPFLWNWDMIQAVLKLRMDFRLDDSSRCNFIKNLVSFLKPSEKNFSKTEFFNKANLYVIAGCDLLDLLCESDSQEANQFLNDFLNDVNKYLEELISAKSVHECFFNPQQITTSSYHFYFLFLGHLSRSVKGRTYLEKLKVFEYLGQIALNISHEIYIKLVISTLDYSADSPARKILSQVLSSPKVSARLYTTKYLHILLRTRLELNENLTKWVIELLVNQLYDESKAVSIVAINALNEACDHRPYLEKMIAIKPCLLHLGDKGLLLLIRFLSIPEGFKYLQEANFVGNELNRWANHFNYRYVRIVESELQEAISQQQRDEKGRSVKHNTGSKHQVPDVFVPPHLYSQLVQHEEGLKLLLSDPGFNALIPILREAKCDIDEGILRLKSSIWALGHFGMSAAGAKFLIEHGVIAAMKNLVLNSPVYTIRATAYYAMAMLATNRQGVAALHSIGWESVRHCRNDQWPVVSPPPYSIFSSFSSSSSPKQESPDRLKSFEDDALNANVSWSHFNKDSFARKSATLPSSTSHSFPVSNNVHIRSFSESKADNCEDSSNSEKFHYDSAEKITDRSQESNTKPRSDSLCTNISSTGSLDSSSSRHHGIGEHVQTLASIPSGSCLDSVKASKSSVPHLTLDQFKSSRRLHYQNILGYTTLRSLNWHRRPHLVPSASTTAALELFTFQDLKQMSPLVRPKLSTKHTPQSISEPEEFHLLNELDFPLADNYPSNSSNLPFHFSDDHNSSHDGLKPAPEEPFYRGICLPLNLECIFATIGPLFSFSHVTAASGKKPKKTKDGSSGESEEEKTSLSEVRTPRERDSKKQHDKSSCLLCVNKTSDRSARVRKVSSSSFHRTRTETESSYGVVGDEESPILLLWHQKSTGILDNPGLETSNSGSSNEGDSGKLDSATRQSMLADKSLNSCSGARKQLLKLIEQLFNPIFYKACKQGLLHLKQLCRDVFQDICVYSEVCVIMSTCSYRAPVRRFVQELFLDAHFNELYDEAAVIIANYKIESSEESNVLSPTSPTLNNKGADSGCNEDLPLQVSDKKLQQCVENRKNNEDSNNSELDVILEIDTYSEVNRNNVSGKNSGSVKDIPSKLLDDNDNSRLLFIKK